MSKKMTNSKRVTEVFSSDVRAFSIYDCERSLPSGIDGLKTSQRKIIFGMRKKFPSNEVKVSIASAGCMEVSCYHHGDLSDTIVKMARAYPGANNVPYLDGIGQFGSRIGPQASAPRYIFVELNGNFRQLFKAEDEPILNYLEDDGTSVEPDFYLPIIPTILLNGADGMGTGFACYILKYNPEVVRKECLAVLKNKKRSKLVPWYRGFTGDISRNEETGQVTFTGKYEIVDKKTMKITELPIGRYTKEYREHLNKLEADGLIRSYDDDSSEERTLFTIYLNREQMAQAEDPEWVIKTFKLTSRESENVTVWNEKGRVRKFANVDEYLKWFVDYRVTRYEDRRLYQIESFKQDLVIATERIRFIEFYLANSKWFSQTAKAEIEKRLVKEKFTEIASLMQIRIYNLTLEQIEKLKEEIKSIAEKIEFLENTTASEIYASELESLKIA